ncbi:hypothetical protein ACFE04_022525 [Oxalis oulophora]
MDLTDLQQQQTKNSTSAAVNHQSLLLHHHNHHKFQPPQQQQQQQTQLSFDGNRSVSASPVSTPPPSTPPPPQLVDASLAIATTRSNPGARSGPVTENPNTTTTVVNLRSSAGSSLSAKSSGYHGLALNAGVGTHHQVVASSGGHYDHQETGSSGAGTGYHHHPHSGLMSFHQGGQQQQQGMGSDIPVDSGDGSENYMRKRFREDLFKEENSTSANNNNNNNSQQTTQGGESGGGSGGGSPNKTGAAVATGNMLRPSNILPGTAMWATAGNTFWMLPMTTTTTSGSGATGPPQSEVVQPPPMWPFTTNPSQPHISNNNVTMQAPLHFMPRFNIPTGNFEFQAAAGGTRTGPLQLGSFLMQQQQPSHNLGLGISGDSNLGMLASLNAYNSSSRSDHNPNLEHQHQHHTATDSGDEDQDTSQ